MNRTITIEPKKYNMEASFITDELKIRSTLSATFQCVWTGDAIGEFKAQFSLDGKNWEDYDESLLPQSFIDAQPEGVSGSFILDIQSVGASWTRLKYNRTSGTGTVEVTIHSKE